MASGALVHGQTNNTTPNEALKQAKEVAKHFKCNDDNKWLDCLRGIDAHTFISYATAKLPQVLEGTEFLPHPAQQTFKGQQYSNGNFKMFPR